MFQRYVPKTFESTKSEYMGYDIHSLSSLIEHGQIPIKHKLAAANYLVIKKIFGFSAVHSRITNAELSLLRTYNMKPLEETSSATVLRELEMLRNMAKEDSAMKVKHSGDLFEIRVKELRFLKSNNSSAALNEFYDGYKAIEKYIEYIAS